MGEDIHHRFKYVEYIQVILSIVNVLIQLIIAFLCIAIYYVINSIIKIYVCFSYDNELQILNRVCFKIKNGDRVSLKGDNGSEKSTLIKLLLGIYKSKLGQVTYNGIDVCDITPE